MAHEIEMIGDRASMAYFGETPWHKLGTPLTTDDIYDWKSVCVKSGLDWEAELVPLLTADTQAKVEHQAVRRKTDGRILGVVGKNYHVLQNRAAFQWFQPFLDAKEAALHTAGSLQEGSRVWVLAKLNRDPLVIAPGDEVEKFILLSHGHDGSLAVRVGFTPIRVVCANTLALAHRADASKLIRVRHSASVVENLANIRAVMSLANAEFEATAEQYRLLARKSINQADLRRYIKRVLKVDDTTKISTRTANMMQQITALCEFGRGNNLASVSGTYWTAYNGVNEWLSYNRGHNQQNRLNSLWFGDSANMNKHALETALSMAV
jgi:phage/plasmid-like protein (TIGR03299 family)